MPPKLFFFFIQLPFLHSWNFWRVTLISIQLSLELDTIELFEIMVCILMSIFPCFHFLLTSQHTPIWLLVLSTYLKQPLQRSPVFSIYAIKSSSYLSFFIYFYLLSAFAIVDYSVLKHTFSWLLCIWLFSLCLTRG